MLNIQDFPKSELEFHERFGDEEKCREYWSTVRWPDGFVCPHCSHHGGWRRTGREEWVCASRACGKETSMRSGTVLHNSPKPIRAWLMAMLHMSVNKQGISALRLKRLMGFGSYKTALRWLRELRRIMAMVDDSALLGPEVEIDETPLGGIEVGGKGLYEGKVWIVGAVERRGKGCGRARLQVIGADRSGHMLGGFVRKNVSPQAIPYTDGAPGYRHLESDGFVLDSRTTTRNGRQIKRKDGLAAAEVHLPQIHKVFSLVKRVVISAYQGSISETYL